MDGYLVGAVIYIGEESGEEIRDQRETCAVAQEESPPSPGNKSRTIATPPVHGYPSAVKAPIPDERAALKRRTH